MKLDKHEALPSFIGSLTYMVHLDLCVDDFCDASGKFDEAFLSTLFDTLKMYPNKVRASFNEIPIYATIDGMADRLCKHIRAALTE